VLSDQIGGDTGPTTATIAGASGPAVSDRLLRAASWSFFFSWISASTRRLVYAGQRIRSVGAAQSVDLSRDTYIEPSSRWILLAHQTRKGA